MKNTKQNNISQKNCRITTIIAMVVMILMFIVGIAFIFKFSETHNDGIKPYPVSCDYAFDGMEKGSELQSVCRSFGQEEHINKQLNILIISSIYLVGGLTIFANLLINRSKKE